MPIQEAIHIQLLLACLVKDTDLISCFGLRPNRDLFMTIKDINLRQEKGRTILSAKCKIRKIGWDTIYFSVASDKSGAVAKDASPFAAALLIPSMKVGEDLIIKGSMS